MKVLFDLTNIDVLTSTYFTGYQSQDDIYTD